MKAHFLTDFFLYKHRYVVGYGLFFIGLVALLFLAGFMTPHLLSQAEMQSAVTSRSLELFHPATIIDLPYHLLQKVSLHFFGLTPVGIKLPSLLIAGATAISLLLLLRRWFKQNVTILAAIIAITASQFLAVAQNGTAIIMLLFWPTILLLLATHVSAESTRILWRKICFFIAAALSLYTPLSLYALIAMAIATLSHPHLRYMVAHMTRWKLALGGAIGLLLSLPLIIVCIKEPLHLATLLGIPADIHWQMLGQNAATLGHMFFGFSQPSLNGIMLQPVYGFATMALIALGILKLSSDHHSARTYTIGVWLIILFFLLLLQPSYSVITFVPLLLILAVGIDTLFREWYGLFPHNPYARIAALVPLAILLSGIVFTGIDRYTNTYTFSPQLAQYFSNDLSLLRSELKKNSTQTLVVNEQERSFYALLQPEYPQLTVLTSRPKNNQPVIVSEAMRGDFKTATPKKIITNHFIDQNARFFIY